MITAINISQGTVRGPWTTIYVFLVTLVAMIYRLPGLMIATCVNSLTVLCLIVAENSGLLPKPNYSVN